MKFSPLVLFASLVLSTQTSAEDALVTIDSSEWMKSSVFSDDSKHLITYGKEFNTYEIESKTNTKKIGDYPFIFASNFDYFVIKSEDESIEVRKTINNEVVNTFAAFSTRKLSESYLSRAKKNNTSKDRIERDKYSLILTVAAALSPDGKYLALCDKYNFDVQLWDVESGKLIKELNIFDLSKDINHLSSSSCLKIVASSDGKYFAVGASNRINAVFVINAKNGELKGRFEADYLKDFGIGDNNKILVTKAEGGEILTWDIQSGKKLKKINGARGSHAIAMSPNGNYIASVANNLTVTLWDASTGKSLKKYYGHTDNVTGLTFSPDNQYLASVSRDRTIRIWGSPKTEKIVLKDIRQPGVVHKSTKYWKQYKNFDTPIKVFTGNISGLSTDKKFKSYYRGVQVAYSFLCRESLPSNAVKRTTVSRVVHYDGSGVETYSEAPKVHDIFIDPRFIDKYDEYQQVTTSYSPGEVLAGAFKMTSNIERKLKNGESLIDATIGVVNEELEIDPQMQTIRFIKASGCNSATVYQMRENFLRAAYNSISLQDEGVEIKNAKNENSSLYEAPTVRTIFHACADTVSSETQSYCSCITKQANKIMTAEEMEYFTKDFSKYRKEVTDNLAGKPANNRVWALNKIRNNCTNK